MRLLHTPTQATEAEATSLKRRAPASPSRREQLVLLADGERLLFAPEDTPPVPDSLDSLQQMRLLADALEASYPGPPPDANTPPGKKRSFVVYFNVFVDVNGEKLAPDVLVSFDATPPPRRPDPNDNIKTYKVSEFGKAPDIVVEIVSNKVGGEQSIKLERYAEWKIPIYMVFDPLGMLGTEKVSYFRLVGGRYVPTDESCLTPLGLGTHLWNGLFKETDREWLRWTDAEGRLLLTGDERAVVAELQVKKERERAEAAELHAEQERQAKEQERQRADAAEQAKEQERQRADAERQRAEQLAAKLRALGLEP